MKKLCLLLLLCFLSVTTALADSPRFDNMRTVVIADTTQDSYAARFMKSRLKQPFRIPYWDRIDGYRPVAVRRQYRYAAHPGGSV